MFKKIRCQELHFCQHFLLVLNPMLWKASQFAQF